MKNLSIVGRIGKDAEVKFSNGGHAVLNVSVACDYQKKEGGEYKRLTQWIRCVVFGKRAESLGKILQKGMRIAASGEFQLNEYTDKKSGGKRVTVEMVANDIEPLFDKKEGGSARQSSQAEPSQAEQQQEYSDESDLPF